LINGYKTRENGDRKQGNCTGLFDIEFYGI